MVLVLLVSGRVDEPLTAALSAREYRVQVVTTGAEARQRRGHDLVVLDLDLPDVDGLLLVEELSKHAPLVVCTARSSQSDRVLSLRMGAADFIDRATEPDEIKARISGVLRARAFWWTPPPEADGKPKTIVISELRIEPIRAQAYVHDQAVHLTPSEYLLLTILATHPDEIVARESLRYGLWGDDVDDGQTQALNTQMQRLRAALVAAGLESSAIIARRSRGYELQTTPI